MCLRAVNSYLKEASIAATGDSAGVVALEDWVDSIDKSEEGSIFSTSFRFRGTIPHFLKPEITFSDLHDSHSFFSKLGNLLF